MPNEFNNYKKEGEIKTLIKLKNNFGVKYYQIFQIKKLEIKDYNFALLFCY